MNYKPSIFKTSNIFILSDHRPNLAKEAELPQESYTSCKRVGHFCHFSSFFLHGSHAYILLFNTSIASVGTDKHIAKIRVSKWPILKILWDFEKCQNGPKVYVERVSSSSHAAVPPIFKHFLIELECWNFRCVMGPPFCMGLFLIFKIGSLPLNSLKVKFFIYYTFLIKFEMQHLSPIAMEIEIKKWGSPFPPPLKCQIPKL